ncbi:hypothetical protein ACH5RR_010428 [Cinchona calisaya]|uniref:Small EDRK-rich factor-like N-terminal domain-containing protein n=1 Tax=Cinchona calisaya TaxID=153742 RepID=A0ABD3AIX3_9GENT
MDLGLSWFPLWGFNFNVSKRDRDRERAHARTGLKAKLPKDDGLTPEQRRERDAKALQEKAARKAAQAGGNNNDYSLGGNKTSIKKKV